MIESAGPRSEVPEADLVAIKTAFRQAWKEETAKDAPAAHDPARFRRQVTGGQRSLALAALLLLALGAAWWRVRQTVQVPTMPVVAEIARIQGTAWFAAPGSERALPLTETDSQRALIAGSTITTAGVARPRGIDGAADRHEPIGRVAMRLTDGTTVRLDTASQLRLVSETTVELISGALYVDTGTAPQSHSIEVRTAFGIARDIGTQFEVRLSADRESMQVKVREGAVRVEQGASSERVDRAESLTMSRDGTVERTTIALSGDEWAWVLRVAPPFAVESPTLSAYLEWLSAETGWQVAFEEEVIAASADTVRIHGGFEHLDPDQTPEVIVPSLGLGYRIEDGTLTVFER